MNKLKAVWALLRSKNYILFTTPDCELTWSKNATVGDLKSAFHRIGDKVDELEIIPTDRYLAKRYKENRRFENDSYWSSSRV